MDNLINADDLKNLATFGERLADAAAEKTLTHFRAALDVANKDAQDFDPVTQADREAEQAIRQIIEQDYPMHSILGEEFDEKIGNDMQWVIDPIDGTRAYITGMPVWGTLIALNQGGTPVLGIFDQPYTGERLIGQKGAPTMFKKGATYEPVQTRACPQIESAICATTDPRFFINTTGEAEMNSLLARAQLMRYGGDCYNYAMLACGQIDAVIEQGLKAHDIQALIPIIEGAGGYVTNWQGGRAAQGGQIIASGDKALHEALIELFSSAAL
ncbi:MAG: histidinol-phosphatase [Parvibaculales bacterium]